MVRDLASSFAECHSVSGRNLAEKLGVVAARFALDVNKVGHDVRCFTCRFTIRVADGTDDAAKRLKRVLNNDPAMGVIRHADAGYDIAKDVARKFRLDLEERLKK